MILLADFFINSLSGGQWLILALIPPILISLYFLKLKRYPLEIPSTYLWHRTIEDLHVNSIWQKLRQSLLLLLQLLVLLLIMLTCLRIGWKGQELTDDRLIFLIDNSASMNATDVSPTRLSEAKRRVRDMIKQMKNSDVGMIISFNHEAQIQQSFTSNRNELLNALERIQPTQRTSNLREALQAASGLANPGMTKFEEQDYGTAEAKPATLYIFTDGGVEAVPDFSLGRLTPEYQKMGESVSANVAVTAFSASENPEKPGQIQLFARIENHGSEPVELPVSLFLNGQVIDASKVSIDAGKAAGLEFADFPEDLLSTHPFARLQLSVEHDDPLQIDNVAYVGLNPPRQRKVLVITEFNPALEIALATEEVAKLAEVGFVQPDILQTEAHQTLSQAGEYDLIIYDRCIPTAMPQANTLFIGKLPPDQRWKQESLNPTPVVIDIDRAHPLMELVELGNVVFAEGFALEFPTGGASLIDADIGTIFAIAPRDGWEDAVLGCTIYDVDDKGSIVTNTNWQIRLSFPLFVKSLVEYLAGSGSAVQIAAPIVQPGEPIRLRSKKNAEYLSIKPPSGKHIKKNPVTQKQFSFRETEEPGIYEVREEDRNEIFQLFTVNLFDSTESNITPREQLKLGYVEVTGKSSYIPARYEAWKWILLLALLVVCFEWYIYNRRVYL